MKRRYFLFVLLILLATYTNAQTKTPAIKGEIPPPPPPPPPAHFEQKKEFKNFRGMRLPESQLDFSLVAIKVFKDNDELYVDLFFNQEINPYSVKSECVHVSDSKPNSENCFQFTKNARGVRFIFNNDEKKHSNEENLFTLEINDIQSLSGIIMKHEAFVDIPAGSEFYKSKENGEWKKS